MIFNLQRFSTHDGSGIRTIVFFKGCPLRCPWCSNPESQRFDYDLFFHPKKCILCLECVKVSMNHEFEKSGDGIDLNRKRIQDPLRFKDICPTKSIQVVGEELNLDGLLQEILKDQQFYANSGGGVTFSGGEPFAQPDELLKLAKELKKRNISTSVETCMDVPWEHVEAVVPFIDEFLIDVKHTDYYKLQRTTGARFERIADHLHQLETRGIKVTVRVPVIPGFNDGIEEMQAIIDFAASLINVQEIHFMPYHSFGKGKYLELGRRYGFQAESLSEQALLPFAEYAESLGLETSIGG